MDKISANITPKTAADSTIIEPKRGRGPYCVSVIGILPADKQIEIQRPLVLEPDPENDAHWTLLQQDDADAVLRVGNDAYAVPVGMVLRIVKPDTSPNIVGVAWA